MINLVNFIPRKSYISETVQDAISMIQKKLLAATTSDSMALILSQMQFDPRYTKPLDYNGFLILQTLCTIKATVEIHPYTQNYFAWKFTPVNGYVNPESPLIINLNTRQTWRGRADWEETIWHELIHVADAFNVASFGHGDNYLAGKDETAPVKIARIMASFSMDTRQLS